VKTMLPISAPLAAQRIAQPEPFPCAVACAPIASASRKDFREATTPVEARAGEGPSALTDQWRVSPIWIVSPGEIGIASPPDQVGAFANSRRDMSSAAI